MQMGTGLTTYQLKAGCTQSEAEEVCRRLARAMPAVRTKIYRAAAGFDWIGTATAAVPGISEMPASEMTTWFTRDIDDLVGSGVLIKTQPSTG